MTKVALKIGISGALIGWLVQTTDTTALRQALGNADPVMLVLGAFVLGALSLVQTWRWLIVARALTIRCGLRAAWGIVLIGTFFNQVLPSSIGGDAARIWRLQRAAVPLSGALNSVLLDRVVALVGVLVIVVTGVPKLFSWSDEPAMYGAIVVLVIAILLGLAVLMHLDKVPFPRRFANSRANRGARDLGRAAREVFLAPRTIVPALILSLVIHLGVSLVVWLIAHGAGVAVGVGDCMVLVPLVILFSTVPVSLAGWGVREGAMVVALGLVGVSSAPALAVSVLFGLALALSGVPGGLLWLRNAERTAVREPATGGSPVV